MAVRVVAGTARRAAAGPGVYASLQQYRSADTFDKLLISVLSTLPLVLIRDRALLAWRVCWLTALLSGISHRYESGAPGRRTGDGRSNLDPPALAAVTFGLAQVGLALLLRGPLARLARRPLVWTAVALVDLSAMTIFLWHQTALIAVTPFGLGYGCCPARTPRQTLHCGRSTGWPGSPSSP